MLNRVLLRSVVIKLATIGEEVFFNRFIKNSPGKQETVDSRQYDKVK